MTYSRDVAPILFAHCVSCHRPGEAAPFGLLQFEQAKRRGHQIVDVTNRGIMPPWLPERGPYPFEGERRLSGEEIETLEQWVDQGMRMGAVSDLPEPPTFRSGWQLGEPDLIVTLAAPYMLRADGPDVFHTFVLPVELDGPRWVRSVELDPDNRRVVHHANLYVDPTSQSRQRGDLELESGIKGMGVVETAVPVGSHFLTWTPGKKPTDGLAGSSWSLVPGTDLILEMHLLPSGREERLQPRVGLYFTEERPSIHPTIISLRDDYLDIPAGDDHYIVEDNLVLPVETQVLAIYPHAHYLGKHMQALATLPDGSTRQLLEIKAWDFNWQDVYRYQTPIPLPAGTELKMHYIYDNSIHNLQNPHQPPRRVLAGNRSYDEMAHLWIQLLPDSREAGMAITEATIRRALAKRPGSVQQRYRLAKVLLDRGATTEALAHFSWVMESDVVDLAAKAANDSGVILAGRKAYEDAESHFQRAIVLMPDGLDARRNLGLLYRSRGQLEEAVKHFRAALVLWPANPTLHYDLGLALRRQEKLDAALEHFERALDVPASRQRARVHNSLGSVLARRGQWSEAEIHFEQALVLDPGLGPATRNLQRVRALQAGESE